jgi:hypothetical protein
MTSPVTTTRRTASIVLLLLAAPLSFTAANAAFVHDPFLSDLRLGAFRDVADVKLEAGWPAGLLAPLSLDPGWVAATTTLAAPWRAECDRVFVAAQGDSVAADPAVNGPFAREILMLAASRAWETGRDGRAATLAEALVSRRKELRLESETAFVWDLRARRLRARAGQPVADGAVWPLLVDLGAYDVRSGWALWVAARRAAKAPVLPAGSATRELGLALASGGEAWLTAAQLRAAGFPGDVESALGAVVLPREALADHFARHAAPPADGLLQGYWLRGQRRRQPLDGAWYENLAATPGLKEGHQLDAWRGASEARVLAGEWEPGLRDLDAGLRLMGGDASKAMRRKMRDWTVKVLVLAVTRGRDDDARRVLASARRHLAAEDAETFAREAAPWLTRIDPAASLPVAATRLQGAQAAVIAGRAAPLPPGGGALPGVETWRDREWEIWSRLGVLLSSRQSAPAGGRVATYAAGLRAVSEAADPAVRQARAIAAMDRFIAGTDAAAPVDGWRLSCAITAAGLGAVTPDPTPLPDLVAVASPRGDELLVHALLGVAIETGDLRGQLAAMALLPTAGLDEDDILRLQYPLPTVATVRDALTAAPVAADLVLAVAKNESLFDPAVRSRAGALGFMQIMPFHYGPAARRLGRDHWSQPAVSIAKGGALLADESRRFDGDPYRVMAAYNAGAGAAQRWDRQLGGHAGRAEFLAWIGYDETRRYVAAVLTDREIYRWLLTEVP